MTGAPDGCVTPLEMNADMKAPDRRASAVYLDTVLRTARVKKAGCQAAVDMIADAGDTRSGKARRRSRTPTTHWYHFHTNTAAVQQRSVDRIRESFFSVTQWLIYGTIYQFVQILQV